MANKKILVIGGAGYIGSHVVKLCCMRGLASRCMTTCQPDKLVICLLMPNL